MFTWYTRRHLILLVVFLSTYIFSQNPSISGCVIESLSSKDIQNATIEIQDTNFVTKTDFQGQFILYATTLKGNYVMTVSKKGYETKRFPILVEEGAVLNLDCIILNKLHDFNSKHNVIILPIDALDNDVDSSDNISGVLNYSRSIFEKTAAFNFSSSFFKMRGLDANYTSLSINGINMNSFYNGRPEWGAWTGIFNILKQKTSSQGPKPLEGQYRNLLSATHISSRASSVKPGFKLIYGSSNRNYTNNILGSYASGISKNGWTYHIALGKRWAREGYRQGTPYLSNLWISSIEKFFGNRHSINLSLIYTPNLRGKSSANTQEVFMLKDNKYNAYWGWQDGEKRNSRIKKTDRPLFFFNHDWKISANKILQTHVNYEFGEIANSRLDYHGTDLVGGIPQGGGSNISPTYYQKLPSYFKRNYPDNLGLAYKSLRAFQNDGQIDWSAMYEANSNNRVQGGSAIYTLYDDVVKHKKINLHSMFEYVINSRMTMFSGLHYSRLKSQNFARVKDLLGAQNYLDVYRFSSTPKQAQNNLLESNRYVVEGDDFKYNYNLFATRFSPYINLELSYKYTDFYVSGYFNQMKYQREGIYQNGRFPDSSLNRGDILNFNGLGLKAGSVFKYTGKHTFIVNTAYMRRPPSIKNVYVNPRENHRITPNISLEHVFSSDISYVFRSPLFRSKLTGYYVNMSNVNNVSFFFADGIGGDNAVFVQEILQGINTGHIGLEFGFEASITQDFKFKGVAALGQFKYINNPNMFLFAQPDETSENAGFINGIKSFGISQLKGYHLSSGPQQAYSLGFEYNFNFWWLSLSYNMFTNSYINISPLRRTSNFNTDFDGLVFSDYDVNIAKQLLEQEQLGNYGVTHIVGGKSWKINTYYIGFFAAINNVFNINYKTGGFEQARNANYRTLRNDQNLDTPVFGSKYWYGRGASYTLNISFRF